MVYVQGYGCPLFFSFVNTQLHSDTNSSSSLYKREVRSKTRVSTFRIGVRCAIHIIICYTFICLSCFPEHIEHIKYQQNHFH